MWLRPWTSCPLSYSTPSVRMCFIRCGGKAAGPLIEKVTGSEDLESRDATPSATVSLLWLSRNTNHWWSPPGMAVYRSLPQVPGHQASEREGVGGRRPGDRWRPWNQVQLTCPILSGRNPATMYSALYRMNVDSGARLPGLESQLCRLPVWDPGKLFSSPLYPSFHD